MTGRTWANLYIIYNSSYTLNEYKQNNTLFILYKLLQLFLTLQSLYFLTKTFVQAFFSTGFKYQGYKISLKHMTTMMLSVEQIRMAQILIIFDSYTSYHF